MINSPFPKSTSYCSVSWLPS